MSDKINPIYRKKIEDIKVEGEEFANLAMKDVFIQQKQALDEVHQFISKLYIDYAKDGLLTMTKAQKDNILTKLKDKLKSMGKELAQSEVAKVTSILKSVFTQTYYKNAYTIESGMTININFKILRPEFVDKAVNQAYKGEMFSDRIWKNKGKMIDKLQSSIVEAMKGNVHLDKVAGDIKNTFNVTAYQSHRLVFTESARVQSQAQLQIGKDSGCKKVMWSATLDTKTNPEDASFDGQVWKIDENHPIPPLHPNCRCCLINIPPTNWSPTARKDNETKQVIAYQTYADWAKAKGIKNY